MERLTKLAEYGGYYVPLPNGTIQTLPVATQEAVDRLAAYEDTGLEPEKVKRLVEAIRKQEVVFLTEDRCMKGICIKVDGHWIEITVARLQEILRAERDDRLAVLPYKAEDVDGRFYLTRLQSLSATEKNVLLMGEWGPAEPKKED